MENVNNEVVVVVLRNPGQSLAVQGGSDIRKNWVNFNILKYYNFPSCNIDHTRALNVGNLMACTAQLPCTSVNCLPFEGVISHNRVGRTGDRSISVSMISQVIGDKSAKGHLVLRNWFGGDLILTFRKF